MNLQTKYMGITLRSPLVVGASPMTDNVDNIKKMEDYGAAAVVLHSLFEEQLTHQQTDMAYGTEAGAYSSAEVQSYFPDLGEYRLGPDEYLKLISDAKKSVSIPIIASLNGVTNGGWIDYATKMEQAGANAIELNIYDIPTDLKTTSEKIELNYLSIVKSVKAHVKIPVAVKLSPFFTNTASMASHLDEAGANALVLFNRFYQPDIDLDHLAVRATTTFSTSASGRIAMRWIAILKNRIQADLAASSGVHTYQDVVKMLLVGANVTMLCSALLKHGIGYIQELEEGLKSWLIEKEYESVEQMIGSMCQMKTENPSAYERAQYMKALTEYKF